MKGLSNKLNMCGIVGFLSFSSTNTPSIEKFSRSIDLLSHRGPDNKGIFFENNIALGHRRLSIIDLSELANQPFSNKERHAWITYNGELYNYVQVRETLIKRGHHFYSNSDTEVILNAYLEWGTDCLDHFNGIFAFAIWDIKKQQLFLARDHIGVKPLFYSIFEGVIYFSSEIKPLLNLNSGLKKADMKGLNSFFSLSYIPAPDTGYENIKQLEPANYLVYKNNNVIIQRYWSLPLDGTKLNYSEDEIVDRLDTMLFNAVKRQTISDVPVGVFLSGGVDSFAIANIVSRLSVKDIKAYSIGFNKKEYNELDNAKLAADKLGLELVSEILNENEANIYEQVANHSSEPFADSSSIPVFLLSKMASKNIKVALSGDGADELFGGYSTYLANKYMKRYRKIPIFIRKNIISPFEMLMPDFGMKYTLKEKASRFIYVSKKTGIKSHAHWRSILPQEYKEMIYSADFYHAVRNHNPFENYENKIIEAKKDAKFCNIMPSLLPISTTNGFSDLESISFITVLANSLKCFFIPSDVPE